MIGGDGELGEIRQSGERADRRYPHSTGSWRKVTLREMGKQDPAQVYSRPALHARVKPFEPLPNRYLEIHRHTRSPPNFISALLCIVPRGSRVFLCGQLTLVRSPPIAVPSTRQTVDAGCL
jgi:hypothetical protein